MNDTDLQSLLELSLKELTDVRSKLLGIIPDFSKLDPVYLLVRREKQCADTNPDEVSPDVFSFATQARADNGSIQIDLVSMPYASLLDNFVIFDDPTKAQVACEVLNQENQAISLAPRTPSMVFYEQLTEVDRVIEKITASLTN